MKGNVKANGLKRFEKWRWRISGKAKEPLRRKG
jgi:hypothetical protein